MTSPATLSPRAPETKPGAEVARKRRRRAPAAGATEDCFTCAGRSVKCDRRRPYCTQCLDIGKDCSGYKTTLTWGVGVASRGKLRGLSLPIAGQKAVPKALSPSTRKKAAALELASDGSVQAKRRNTISVPPASTNSNDQHRPTIAITPSANVSPSNTKPDVPTFRQSPDQTRARLTEWNGQAHSKSQATGDEITQQSAHARRPSQHIQPNQYGQAPMSSMGGVPQFSSQMYSSSPMHSLAPTFAPNPYSYSNVRSRSMTSVPQITSLHQHWAQTTTPQISQEPVKSAAWHQAATQDSPRQTQTTFDPTFVDSVNYMDFSGEKRKFSQEEDDIEEIFRDTSTIPTSSYATPGTISAPQFDQSGLYYSQQPQPKTFTMNSIVHTPAIGSTQRMRYLINYYDRVIAPVIVAFDGPSNPYRTHILRVASESETLQHAIAALSASNIRIRRESNAISTCKTQPARESLIAHCQLTGDSSQEAPQTPEDQVREETRHKNAAIASLNMQLADPVLRQHDSVLATLLILCLFHICDTGVARFRTQFAGVKKLLTMRLNGPNRNSEETRWYTRMFTWFDAMTATVNDRDGQLQGVHLDMASLADEEWALENLAGCDGRLFNIFAKLGRLNILSQRKKVAELPPTVPRPPPTPVTPYQSLGNGFDGNMWTQVYDETNPGFIPHTFGMTPPTDISSPSSATSPQSYHAGLVSNTGSTTQSIASEQALAQFWYEWRLMRQSLQSWQLDTTAFHPQLTAAIDPFTPDLLNISESFRYSAMLYTERLAFPTFPSTHPRIQNLVVSALTYINKVQSDVYLLWPLFITGSECVLPSHREMVRKRCQDIQKDSGFMNNISCLQLLERIWAKEPAGGNGTAMRSGFDGDMAVAYGLATGMPGRAESGFKWRSVMGISREEGEYIVV